MPAGRKQNCIMSHPAHEKQIGTEKLCPPLAVNSTIRLFAGQNRLWIQAQCIHFECARIAKRRKMRFLFVFSSNLHAISQTGVIV